MSGSEESQQGQSEEHQPEDQGSLNAQLLARGVCRMLGHLGFATLPEFSLRSGRRVDVFGLDRAGQVAIVEIKSSLADYRSDQKWQEYLDYCDLFYFAVSSDFPHQVLPEECGLIIADPYGAEILRPSPSFTLNAARRRAQMLRFGRVAARRLSRLVDPDSL